MDHLAGEQLRAGELHVLEGRARKKNDRRLVAEHLFDGALEERAVAAEQRQLVGVLEQREEPVPDQVARRLVSGVEHLDDHGDELVGGQPVAGLLGRDQRAQQVVARLLAAFPDQLSRVVFEAAHGPVHREPVLLGGVARRQAQVGGPGSDLFVIDGGNRQQLADHLERQSLREGGVEVHLAPLRRRLGQRRRDALGDGLHVRHLARCEGPVQQPPQPVVVWRIEKDRCAPDPLDVRPVAPALLLVVAAAHGAEPVVGQCLKDVLVAQQHGGPHLGDPGRPRAAGAS